MMRRIIAASQHGKTPGADMNFHDKVFETTADFRARAVALSHTAIDGVRVCASAASSRVAVLRSSLSALRVAGRELNKVTRRHVSRLVKQNSSIARNAGKEFSALARATLQQLSQDAAPARKVRKPPKVAAGKRTAKAA
jgi:hypothetical protein